MTPRLKCCRPSAWSAGSRTIVHTCDEKRDEPLTTEEFAEWQSRLMHPSFLPPLIEVTVPSWREPEQFTDDEEIPNG